MDDASLIGILLAAAPAILNSVAAPVAAATQLALLGHSHVDPARTVAAYAAVDSSVTFVASLCNFLNVVAMARVGQALGAKRWTQLGVLVRVALCAALCCGVAAALLLRSAQEGIVILMSLEPDVADATRAYLQVALLRLPSLLLLRSASGVLTGYQRVGLASAINTTLAAADAAAFYLVLAVRGDGLVQAGAAAAFNCTCAAAVAVLVVAACPPDGRARLCPACGGGKRDAAPAEAPVSWCQLTADSSNVLLRSLLLSGSMYALSVRAAMLGAAPLAAHAVVMQLWMITSYVADGFADVGTMRGAKMLGAGDGDGMRRLTVRIAALGVATGVGAAAVMAAYRDGIASLFTRDAAVVGALRDAWPLLCALQPINATVFVYDGLMYATQSFAFVRNALAIGVLGGFAPALWAAATFGRTLRALWVAKAVLNSWRCVSALFRIHVQLWPTWRRTAGELL